MALSVPNHDPPRRIATPTAQDLRDEVYREFSHGPGGGTAGGGTPIRCLPTLNSLIKGHRSGEMTVLTGPTGAWVPAARAPSPRRRARVRQRDCERVFCPRQPARSRPHARAPARIRPHRAPVCGVTALRLWRLERVGGVGEAPPTRRQAFGTAVPADQSLARNSEADPR